jgi:GDP-mannose 6-dehydrogenase
VVGVDIDPAKLSLLRRGVSPIVEEGMADLISEAMTSGRAHVTDSAPDAIGRSEVSFVCVGTPSRRNGSHDLTALMRVCEQIGESIAAKDGAHVVVIRSTVAPGTTEDVLVPLLERCSGRKSGSGLEICFQPEFLREGVSIKDFERPPMTVVGGADRGVRVLRELFGDLPCKFFGVGIRTAEMVKFCCNAFHALKVTFANEVGRLCKGLEIDGREVMGLLCEDKHLNISAAYLRPGFAFGGSCLPKDLRALVSMSREAAVDLPVLGSVLASNETQIAHALQTVLATNARTVGLVGLSFKGGTDDLRESPLLELAERLIGKGRDVKIYDPEVNLSRLIGSNRAFLTESIPHIASIMEDRADALLESCEVIVLGMRDVEVENALRQGRAHIVVDLVGVPEPERMEGSYRGICW